MRTHATGAGIAVLAIMASGWLLGLAAQHAVITATTYADVSPQLLLLGMALCTLGGVAARLLAPASRRIRDGMLAGVGTLLAILAGYATLIALHADLFAAHEGGGGETWFSLLLEAWFWIGVPLVASAGLGALGWLASDRLAGRGTGGTSAADGPAARSTPA